MQSKCHFGFRRGFTLVELLVVIGIIALLVGILMPALSNARRQANTVACMANMRSIGQGLTTYVAEFKGAIPGPNTSGRLMNTSYWYGTVKAKWADETSPTEPTFNMDWVSPSMGRQLDLPKNRADRLVTSMMLPKLRCPENDMYYAYLFNGGGDSGGWPTKWNSASAILSSSYSATLGFQ